MACATGVCATRLGIMKLGRPLGLPNADSTSAGAVSTMLNVLSSMTFIDDTSGISWRPVLSDCAQRWIEATQSSAFTGVPSCHFRPSRRVKV
ncbi:hypothetical protein D3C87_1092270 [compost metagenome]